MENFFSNLGGAVDDTCFERMPIKLGRVRDVNFIYPVFRKQQKWNPAAWSRWIALIVRPVTRSTIFFSWTHVAIVPFRLTPHRLGA